MGRRLDHGTGRLRASSGICATLPSANRTYSPTTSTPTHRRPRPAERVQHHVAHIGEEPHRALGQGQEEERRVPDALGRRQRNVLYRERGRQALVPRAGVLDDMAKLLPGAVAAVVSASGTPLLGGVAGPVTQFVLDRIKGGGG